MQKREVFQSINRRKAIWIVLVILLLVVAFLVINFVNAAEGESVWSKTVRQVRTTVSTIGYSLGVAPEPKDPLDIEGDTEGSTEGELPTLPPPVEGGAVIGEPSTPRSLDRGTFVVNTHLRAGGNLVVTGSAELAGLSVANMAQLSQLQVSGPAEMVGALSALGGIRMGGADIDLEGGRIIGLDPVVDIQAGENVVVSGTPERPIISVPNIPREAVVTSLNGERGNLDLRAGNDIAINGLTIANTSTLASVRSRGGCVGCLLDSDVADDLTIDGGTINNTVIGALTPAAAYFTNVSITSADSSPALVVNGTTTFTGRVKGLQATENDEFVTLDQVSHLFAGEGYTGVAFLNSMVGALTIAGTAGQVNVTSADKTITLSLPQDISITSSPTFAALVLSGGLTVGGDADVVGIVRASSFESLDATVRGHGEEVLRASISVFPYALPAETGSTSFTRMSKQYGAGNNPVNEAPAPIAGTTRVHRLMMKYADSVSAASSLNWRIIDTASSAVVGSFTTPGQAMSDLEEPEVFITDPVTIPSGGWRLEVQLPSGRVRVTDIHMLAFDVID